MGESASSDIPCWKYIPFGNKRGASAQIMNRGAFLCSCKNIMIFLLKDQLLRIVDVGLRDTDFIGLAFICSSPVLLSFSISGSRNFKELIQKSLTLIVFRNTEYLEHPAELPPLYHIYPSSLRPVVGVSIEGNIFN